MKRKNNPSRMQQKRIDTLLRLGQKHGFNAELMVNGWTTEIYTQPIHVQNLVRKIHSHKGD